jgi:hypothetical protein
MTQFISNGTDVLASSLPLFGSPETEFRPWHAQVVPTLLYRNQTALKGELWRSLIIIDRLSEEGDDVWDDFCITDMDQATYAEVPINEMVFWSNNNGKIVEVELPAFRVTLKRAGDKSDMMTREGADTHVIVQR